jgi:hypothetical protein
MARSVRYRLNAEALIRCDCAAWVKLSFSETTVLAMMQLQDWGAKERELQMTRQSLPWEEVYLGKYRCREGKLEPGVPVDCSVRSLAGVNLLPSAIYSADIGNFQPQPRFLVLFSKTSTEKCYILRFSQYQTCLHVGL